MTSRRGSASEKSGLTREDYSRGLPDYHDPLAGIGGAPPAQSALTARLVFAVFGLVSASAGVALFLLASVPVGFLVLMCVIAAALVVDIAVIVHRKRRGEPG